MNNIKLINDDCMNVMKTYKDFPTAQIELSKIILFLQKYSVCVNHDEDSWHSVQSCFSQL